MARALLIPRTASSPSQRTDCCSGLCDTTFKLSKVISRKQCSACSAAELKAPEVPKQGELPTDTEVEGKLIPKVDGST